MKEENKEWCHPPLAHNVDMCFRVSPNDRNPTEFRAREDMFTYVRHAIHTRMLRYEPPPISSGNLDGIILPGPACRICNETHIRERPQIQPRLPMHIYDIFLCDGRERLDHHDVHLAQNKLWPPEVRNCVPNSRFRNPPSPPPKPARPPTRSPIQNTPRPETPRYLVCQSVLLCMCCCGCLYESHCCCYCNCHWYYECYDCGYECDEYYDHYESYDDYAYYKYYISSITGFACIIVAILCIEIIINIDV